MSELSTFKQVPSYCGTKRPSKVKSKVLVQREGLTHKKVLVQKDGFSPEKWFCFSVLVLVKREFSSPERSF